MNNVSYRISGIINCMFMRMIFQKKIESIMNPLQNFIIIVPFVRK